MFTITLRPATVTALFGAMLLLGVSTAHTQTVSLQEDLLKDWAALRATMHKIADEMPADKYGFRPTAAQQTFGERVVHVAVVNVAILGTLGESTVNKPTIDPKATSKEAALAALDASFDYGVALLKEQSNQTLLQPAAAPPRFLGPSTRARIIAALSGHTWDTYGQLAVYLRLNGQVPPASKGGM